MNPHSPEFKDFSSSLRDLLSDFARISGAAGARVATYVLAGAFVEGIGISLLVPLLGLIFGASAVPRWIERSASAAFSAFGAETRASRLLLLLGLFVALLLLRALVISARDIGIFRLQARFVEAQQMRVADRLAWARWQDLAGLRHARIAQLVGGDIQRLGVGVHFVVGGCVAAAVFLVQCALAFLLAPALGAALTLLLVTGVVCFAPLLARARSFGDYVADANLSLLDTTTQFLGGLKLAVSQNLQVAFVGEFRATLRHLADRQLRFAKQHVLSASGATALFGFVGAAAVLAGLLWFEIAPSVLVTLLLVFARMTAPIGQMQQAGQQLVHLLAVFERIQRLRSELPYERGLAVTTSEASYPAGEIVFEKASYCHGRSKDRRNGIHALDLTITPGEFLAVTGASGAGKTTFADLLAGLYPPQSGTVVAGGQPLTGTPLHVWRSALAYVPQDSFLFHDTIRRNLLWANGSASETELWEALGIVGAESLVRQMAKGLDTIVGERGALVSGGERQRIALARALLRRPKLFILDEATSALDSASERGILAHLRMLVPRPTIVLVAHRAENFSLCDRVVRLDAGILTPATRAILPDTGIPQDQ